MTQLGVDTIRPKSAASQINLAAKADEKNPQRHSIAKNPNDNLTTLYVANLQQKDKIADKDDDENDSDESCAEKSLTGTVDKVGNRFIDYDDDVLHRRRHFNETIHDAAQQQRRRFDADATGARPSQSVVFVKKKEDAKAGAGGFHYETLLPHHYGGGGKSQNLKSAWTLSDFGESVAPPRPGYYLTVLPGQTKPVPPSPPPPVVVTSKKAQDGLNSSTKYELMTPGKQTVDATVVAKPKNEATQFRGVYMALPSNITLFPPSPNKTTTADRRENVAIVYQSAKEKSDAVSKKSNSDFQVQNFPQQSQQQIVDETATSVKQKSEDNAASKSESSSGSGSASEVEMTQPKIVAKKRCNRKVALIIFLSILIFCVVITVVLVVVFVKF